MIAIGTHHRPVQWPRPDPQAIGHLLHVGAEPLQLRRDRVDPVALLHAGVGEAGEFALAVRAIVRSLHGALTGAPMSRRTSPSSKSGAATRSADANWLDTSTARSISPPLAGPAIVSGRASPSTRAPSDRSARASGAIGRSRIRREPSRT